jgi:hypothetical protein
MLVTDYARQYGVSKRTVLRWKAKGHPIDDPARMATIREEEKSRRGVGKYTPRFETVTAITPVREVVAEIMPVEPIDVPADENVGTLQRLEQAERLAFKRFQDSGGNERAGQLWLLCADQLRKTRDSSAKLASDVSEAETKFIGMCAEIILELKNYLEAAPSLLAVLCCFVSRLRP